MRAKRFTGDSFKDLIGNLSMKDTLLALKEVLDKIIGYSDIEIILMIRENYELVDELINHGVTHSEYFDSFLEDELWL